MSISRAIVNNDQHITPTLSFVDRPLTPPRTDEKAFTQAPRVIALFEAIETGRLVAQSPWTAFQLRQGEYDEVERRIARDEGLFGYVKDKIRYVVSNFSF